MTDYVVSSGQTSNGLTLGSGDLLQVIGGTAVGTIVDGGSGVQINTSSGNISAVDGIEILLGGVTSNSVLNGGFEAVSSGTAVGTTLDPGMTILVASGGTSTQTVSGGIQIVGSAGVASNTTANAGFQVVFGSAIGTVLASSGTSQFVYQLASDTTVEAGAVVIVEAGGVTSGTTVDSGGSQVVSGGGTANSTVVLSGGVESIASGATDSSSLIASGGIETVSSGGTAIGTVVGAASSANVITPLHYAPNANEAFGSYDAPGDPGSDGFNLSM